MGLRSIQMPRRLLLLFTQVRKQLQLIVQSLSLCGHILEHEKMPHEVYNFILERCFDACISTFNHKTLINSERECLGSCVTTFKQNPKVFQECHQFAGFAERSESDNMPLPGMGGIKDPKNFAFSSGLGKMGGGMI